MHSKNIDYHLLYKSMAALRENNKNVLKQIGIPNDKIKELVKHARDYSYANQSSIASAKDLNNTSARILLNSFTHSVKEIHDARKMMRAVEQRSRINDCIYESRSNGYESLNKAFPSARIDVKCEIGQDVSIRPMYHYDQLVEGGIQAYVPVTWYKKIHQEGIDVVQAGDGARFILDCKERHITRLQKDYIRCWAVRAVKRKHQKAIVENATVMRYDAGGDVITSISNTFGKAESLLRRRIKDAAVGVLMEL